MTKKNPELSSLQDEVKESLTELSNEDQATEIQKRSEISGFLEAIKPSNNQKLIIVNHWHTIGADRQLMSDTDELNRAIVNKWFNVLVVDNDLFPTDLPINFVLDEFFRAIVKHKVEVKGFNLMAHTKAFRFYISEYETELRRTYFHKTNPDKRQKTLPESASKSAEEIQSDSKKLYEFLDNTYGENPPVGIDIWKQKLKAEIDGHENS